MLDISSPQRLHDLPMRADADHPLGIGRNSFRGLRCLLIMIWSDFTPEIKSIKIWVSSSALNVLLENGFLDCCTINLISCSFGFLDHYYFEVTKIA